MEFVTVLLNSDCVTVFVMGASQLLRKEANPCDRRWNSRHVQSEILWLLLSNSYRPPAPADGVAGLWMS